MLVCGSRMQAVTNCSNATKFDRPEAVEEKRKASTNSDQNLELRQCLICTLRALVRCDPISIGCARRTGDHSRTTDSCCRLHKHHDCSCTCLRRGRILEEHPRTASVPHLHIESIGLL